MEEKDIREICTANQLQCNKIIKTFGSFGKELFCVDDKYLIRTSKKSMLDELNKINRIKDLIHVPKLYMPLIKAVTIVTYITLYLSIYKALNYLQIIMIYRIKISMI